MYWYAGCEPLEPSDWGSENVNREEFQNMTSGADSHHSGNRAKARATLFAMIATVLAPAAWTLEVAQAHVAVVETTYMPSSITFQVDSGTTSCPIGTWLRWINGNVDNVKSAFALLLAAVNNGGRIQYFINNGDTTCQVQFLYALPS
jgi:hypothetical protein